MALQVKLLRVLQERKVRAVGSDTEQQVDVRIVAATNRDLEAEVAANGFRQDLFYRLNVIRLRLPALRERREDIPLLAEHLLAKHASLQGKKLQFSPETLKILLGLSYPGNVRELENIVEPAVTLASDGLVRADALPEEAINYEPRPILELPCDGSFDLDTHLQREEQRLLSAALERAEGVRTQAAKLLGLSFRSFRYRLAKYNMDEGDDSDPDQN